MNKKYKKVNSKFYSIKNSTNFLYNLAGKILLALVFIFNTSTFAQELDPVKGKALFNSNCAACHKLDKKMTGPALRGVEKRLYNDEGLDKEWMYSWIRNSASLIKSGDDYANKIYAEYNGSAMTAFPQLSDSEIDNILSYTAQEKAVPVVKITEVAVGNENNSNGISNEIILGAFAFVFLLLALGLFLVNKTLRRFAVESNIELPTKKISTRKPLWKAFVDNQFLLLCSAILMLLVSAYFVYGFLMQIGVNQGYEPVQPIHYSHKIHAGDNEIDCKYCHSSARVSKHSGIPSLNVCMNCHKSIYEYNGETTEEYSKEFYDAEIQKLYKAVGWDDESQEYTGETQAVKWVRIHNLPDFAYFNHAQHVSVAGIECQTCHGPVEEMEIMYQYSPLTMGWCINCHRETNVKVKDNQYYEKIHEQLSKKYGVDKLTAAQMGGLECGKCHY
ncbi:MAG: c-type cytochrome [Flavobacteriaceae bacterium]|nr:c-type cytochrome [Flavobacteriaceae bacterium]